MVDRRELLLEHVLRLTYTARNTAPFARDIGYDDPPLLWKPEQRRHLRAPSRRPFIPPSRTVPRRGRLRLDSFPLLRRQDEAEFWPLSRLRPHPHLHDGLTPATLRRSWPHRC